MRRSHEDDAGLHVAAQVAAAWARLDAAHRAEELSGALSRLDRAFLDAMRQMQAVRDFVGSPENILGRTETKHGEIAEQIHVGVRRALDVLYGRTPTATFDGVPRTGPVDYRVDGVDIQSKYYNGLRNTLKGVSEHAERHPDFAGGHGRYNIPSDQHRQLEELRGTGEIDGLSARSADAVRRSVDRLEQAKGRSTDDLIEPGEGTYGEVQRGRVHDTIRDRDEGLVREKEKLERTARAEHGPSLAGLGKAAALGAAAAGGVSLAQALWVKYREGRTPFRGDFSVEDWREVGVVAAQGAGGGMVAGGTLYVLTNCTALAAPFAGSLVSGLMGVGSLLRDYQVGMIDADQFVDLAHIVALDASTTGLAAAAGQVLIPLPLLGALMGSLAGHFVSCALKDGLGKSESALTARLDEYQRYALERLDTECSAVLQQLDDRFGNLERMAGIAFDQSANTELRLKASVGFAQAVGVPDARILRTTTDVDVYMKE